MAVWLYEGIGYFSQNRLNQKSMEDQTVRRPSHVWTPAPTEQFAKPDFDEVFEFHGPRKADFQLKIREHPGTSGKIPDVRSGGVRGGIFILSFRKNVARNPAELFCFILDY